MKVHARAGAAIVGTIPGSAMFQKAIEHHHETFDGSGYPNALRGEEIPLWARILGLADAFVNMTTERDLRGRQNHRTGRGRNRKVEWHPVRRNARARPHAPTQDRKDAGLGD